MLIGSIAIGLVVDDTLHFLHHFHRYFLETADAARAVEQAMYTTGRAILITTLALSLGFATFCVFRDEKFTPVWFTHRYHDRVSTIG